MHNFTKLSCLFFFFFIIACNKKDQWIQLQLPEVITKAPGKITSSSAVLKGQITKTGTSPILEYGFCWSILPNPTLQANKNSNGGTNTPLAFSNFISSLNENTTYYIRAYATNLAGTVYGNEIKLKTIENCKEISLFFDGVHINSTGSFDNDHIDISTNGPLSTIGENTSFTIEAWVKRGHINNPTGLERIISKDHIFQFRIVNN